jgi:RNA polymerase sigma-70 factor (ECF subfamily)
VNTSEPSQNIRQQIVELLPRLRRFARHLTRHPADADDIVQVAIERALKHQDQWRRDARFDSWMFRIVRNAWIDEVRARGRRNQLFVEAEAGEHVGQDTIDSEATLMSVQAAMARLPEEQRLAVSLVLIEGLPYREAAEVLEVPIGTLTSRLARGREALQSMLGDEGEHA